jgi:hypothetical protein
MNTLNRMRIAGAVGAFWVTAAALAAGQVLPPVDPAPKMPPLPAMPVTPARPIIPEPVDTGGIQGDIGGQRRVWDNLGLHGPDIAKRIGHAKPYSAGDLELLRRFLCFPDYR